MILLSKKQSGWTTVAYFGWFSFSPKKSVLYRLGTGIVLSAFILIVAFYRYQIFWIFLSLWGYPAFNSLGGSYFRVSGMYSSILAGFSLIIPPFFVASPPSKNCFALFSLAIFFLLDYDRVIFCGCDWILDLCDKILIALDVCSALLSKWISFLSSVLLCDRFGPKLNRTGP